MSHTASILSFSYPSPVCEVDDAQAAIDAIQAWKNNSTVLGFFCQQNIANLYYFAKHIGTDRFNRLFADVTTTSKSREEIKAVSEDEIEASECLTGDDPIDQVDTQPFRFSLLIAINIVCVALIVHLIVCS